MTWRHGDGPVVVYRPTPDPEVQDLDNEIPNSTVNRQNLDSNALPEAGSTEVSMSSVKGWSDSRQPVVQQQQARFDEPQCC